MGIAVNLKEKLKQAAGVLRQGGIVIFPTETVYGIGCIASNLDSVERIYKIKNRPRNNPLTLHISNIDMLEGYVSLPIRPDIRKIIDRFMPGPLTIVLDASGTYNSRRGDSLNTIGIRMPSGAAARRLIELTGEPLFATSANISGKPSSGLSQMDRLLVDAAGCIIESDIDSSGLASTVLDCSDDLWNKGRFYKILRRGSMVQKLIGAGLPIEY